MNTRLTIFLLALLFHVGISHNLAAGNGKKGEDTGCKIGLKDNDNCTLFKKLSDAEIKQITQEAEKSDYKVLFTLNESEHLFINVKHNKDSKKEWSLECEDIRDVVEYLCKILKNDTKDELLAVIWVAATEILEQQKGKSPLLNARRSAILIDTMALCEMWRKKFIFSSFYGSNIKNNFSSDVIIYRGNNIAKRIFGVNFRSMLEEENLLKKQLMCCLVNECRFYGIGEL